MNPPLLLAWRMANTNAKDQLIGLSPGGDIILHENGVLQVA